jgi:hypothetical protein
MGMGMGMDRAGMGKAFRAKRTHVFNTLLYVFCFFFFFLFP